MGSELPRNSPRVTSFGKPRVQSFDQDRRGRSLLSSFVSFVVQQRLTLHGAFEDTTLPAPMVTESTEKFQVTVEEGADDLFEYGGICKESAPRFRKTKGHARACKRRLRRN